jgi:zinc transport system permease protein
MAIGILFISQTPGYNVNLTSYLFGNILMVSQRELWLMAAMDLAILSLVGLFYKQFLAVSFDEEFAKLRGVPVTFFYLLLLVLVAITVVLLIQVVGLILVIALLTLPAAIAGHYMRTLAGMMGLGAILGMTFSSGGLLLAWQPDLPQGPIIILLATSSYLISLLIQRLRS